MMYEVYVDNVVA